MVLFGKSGHNAVRQFGQRQVDRVRHVAGSKLVRGANVYDRAALAQMTMGVLSREQCGSSDEQDYDNDGDDDQYGDRVHAVALSNDSLEVFTKSASSCRGPGLPARLPTITGRREGISIESEPSHRKKLQERSGGEASATSFWACLSSVKVARFAHGPHPCGGGLGPSAGIRFPAADNRLQLDRTNHLVAVVDTWSDCTSLQPLGPH